MNLKETYEIIDENARLVLGGVAIGIFGPIPPKDGDHLTAALNLENGTVGYTGRQLAYFGQSSNPSSRTLEQSTKMGVDILKLAHAGVLVFENYSESEDVDRSRTRTEFDKLQPEKEVGRFYARLMNIGNRDTIQDTDLLEMDTYISGHLER